MISSEPKTFTAGETLAWEISLPDYSPSAGWTLKYYFRSPSGTGFDVTATTAPKGNFAVSVPASATIALIAGTIHWQAWVSRGEENHLTADGDARVRVSFASVGATQSVDNRTENRRTLDAINAKLAGKVTDDVQRYMIGNRSLERIPLIELHQLQKHYAALVAAETRAKNNATNGFLKPIGVRFREPK